MDIPRTAKAYGLLIAFLIFPIAIYSIPSSIETYGAPMVGAFVVFALLTFFTEVYEVELVYRRAISTGIAFTIAAIILGGITLALPIALISTLLAESFLRWGRIKQSFTNFLWLVGFNTGQIVIATFIAALVYHSLGGEVLLQNTSNEAGTISVRQILPALSAFISLELTNILLVSVMTTLAAGTSMLYHFRFDTKHLLAQVLTLGVLSILMAVTYAQSPWNLLLVLVPMGLVHVSLRNYMKLRHEAKQTFESMADMLHARDPYTFEHSDEVADLAENVARHLGMHEDEIEQVRSGALIHDVGKIGIPDSILKKPAKLNDAEWEVMKTHPDIGADLIKDLEMYAGVVDLVRHEHEHWDGNGYPKGLQGEEIPMGARIIAVADAYNALTTDRPYRDAYPHDRAVEIIKSESGTHFDPKVVEAFLNVVDPEQSQNAHADSEGTLTSETPNQPS